MAPLDPAMFADALRRGHAAKREDNIAQAFYDPKAVPMIVTRALTHD